MCRERWWRSRKYSWQMGHERASSLRFLECRSGPAYSFLWWDRIWKTKSEVMRKERLHFAHRFWVDKPREVNVGGKRAQEAIEEDEEDVGIWAMACFSHSVGAPKKAPQRGAFCGNVCKFQKLPTKSLEFESWPQQGPSIVLMSPNSSPRASADLPSWKKEVDPGLPNGYRAGLLKALLCSIRVLLDHTEKTVLLDSSLGMSWVSCWGLCWPVRSPFSLSLACLSSSLFLSRVTSVKALWACSQHTFWASGFPNLSLPEVSDITGSAKDSSWLPPSIEASESRWFIFSSSTGLQPWPCSGSLSWHLFSAEGLCRSPFPAAMLTSRAWDSLAR